MKYFLSSSSSWNHWCNFYQHWNSLYHKSHLWRLYHPHMKMTCGQAVCSSSGSLSSPPCLASSALVWTMLYSVLVSGDHNPGGELHKLTLQCLYKYFGFNCMISCYGWDREFSSSTKSITNQNAGRFLVNMAEFEHCTCIFPWQVLSLLNKLLLLFTPSSLGYCFWYCVN